MKRRLLAVLWVAGCGPSLVGRAASQPLPATVDEARVELRRWTARIDELRAQAGLPPARDQPGPGTEPPPPEAATTPMSSPPRSPMSPPPSPSPSPSRGEASTEVVSAPDRPARRQRCRDVRTAADEICDAAERICRLAEQIADDDAHRRCESARADCRLARRLADGC